MPNPSQTTKEMEREAAKFAKTDQLHSSDQSLHQQEIMKEREKGQGLGGGQPLKQKGGEELRDKK
jgi:hypothetical protein